MANMYDYLGKAWKRPRDIPDWNQRLIQLRKEPTTFKIEKPTRLDKARAIGYKAKQGFIVVRQKTIKGGHRRDALIGGRRSAHSYMTMSLRKSYQVIAEERVQRMFPNLLVLNSYYLAEDGKNKWFEVILIDPCHPQIKNDSHLKNLCEIKHRSRVYHGKTSAGRKMRGLRRKGKGAEKMRPSRRAHLRKG